MDHRNLMLSRAGAKSKFAFLKLPPALQDEIIDGLDGGYLTLQAASEKIRRAGHKLSREAVSNYYRAVRRERRLFAERVAALSDSGGRDADSEREGA